MSIIINDLTKKYGEKTVLSDFSLKIEDKEKITVMGSSGCGKTTLIRIIAGLEIPDSGELLNVPEKISFVFQENRLCEDFSSVSNVMFVTGKSISKEEIEDNLKLLGLSDSLYKPVKNLSGGMKRRVAIARALLSDYDLLIMDEPFKGLDEELKLSVLQYVKEKTKDKTVIFVTHNMDEAKLFSERIINLN